MRKLPGAVESRTKEEVRQLAGLLPGLRRVDVDDARFCDDLTGDAISIDSPPPFLKESDKLNLLLLNLATSVFTCLGSTISSICAGPRLRCGALQTHWDRRLGRRLEHGLLLAGHESSPYQVGWPAHLGPMAAWNSSSSRWGAHTLAKRSRSALNAS